MAFTYGFYNSMNGDRKYNAEQMSAIFDGLIHDGVFHSQGEIFGVIPGDGMQVVVKSGRAWFNHTWNYNDGGYPVNIAPADVALDRIDAVILEVGRGEAERKNRMRVITGTPATSPAKPLLVKGSNEVYQWPLAYVTVPAAAGVLTASNIQQVVGTAECPFVTGILASVNIDILFAQWQSDFDAWWANIKATLNENVVTNLQNQINDRVKIADLATQAEALTGTSNTKWMSPLRVKESVDASIDAATKIGDILLSGRNLELETDGKFIRLDGRTLTNTAYPLLNAAIGDRIIRPTTASTSAMAANIQVQTSAQSPSGQLTVIGQYSNTTIYVKRFHSNGTQMASYTQGSPFGTCYARFCFYIGEQCYVVAVGTQEIRIGTVSDSTITQITQISSLTGIDHMSNGGTGINYCVVIGNTAYLTVIYGSGTSYTVLLITVIGTSVTQRTVWTTTSAANTILLGRTLYIGGTVNQQTDVATVNPTAITNTIIKNLVAQTRGNTLPRCQTPDGKTLLMNYPSPANSALILRENDEGVITQEIIGIHNQIVLGDGQLPNTLNALGSSQVSWTILPNGIIAAAYITGTSGSGVTPVSFCLVGVCADSVVWLSRYIQGPNVLAQQDVTNQDIVSNYKHATPDFIIGRYNAGVNSGNTSGIVLIRVLSTQFQIPAPLGIFTTGGPNLYYVKAKD